MESRPASVKIVKQGNRTGVTRFYYPSAKNVNRISQETLSFLLPPRIGTPFNLFIPAEAYMDADPDTLVSFADTIPGKKYRALFYFFLAYARMTSDKKTILLGQRIVTRDGRFEKFKGYFWRLIFSSACNSPTGFLYDLLGKKNIPVVAYAAAKVSANAMYGLEVKEDGKDDDEEDGAEEEDEAREEGHRFAQGRPAKKKRKKELKMSAREVALAIETWKPLETLRFFDNWMQSANMIYQRDVSQEYPGSASLREEVMTSLDWPYHPEIVFSIKTAVASMINFGVTFEFAKGDDEAEDDEKTDEKKEAKSEEPSEAIPLSQQSRRRAVSVHKVKTWTVEEARECFFGTYTDDVRVADQENTFIVPMNISDPIVMSRHATPNVRFVPTDNDIARSSLASVYPNYSRDQIVELMTTNEAYNFTLSRDIDEVAAETLKKCGPLYNNTADLPKGVTKKQRLDEITRDYFQTFKEIWSSSNAYGGSYQAAINLTAELVQKKMNLFHPTEPFGPRCHDPFATRLYNMIEHLREGENFTNTCRHWFVLWVVAMSAVCDAGPSSHYNSCLHAFILSDPGSGKSHTTSHIGTCCMVGSVNAQTHRTQMAKLTATNIRGGIELTDEVSSNQVGSNNPPSDIYDLYRIATKKVTTSSPGPGLAVYKQMMTNKLINTEYIHSDKNTGERWTIRLYSIQHVASILNGNITEDEIPEAIANRAIRISLPNVPGIGKAPVMQRFATNRRQLMMACSTDFQRRMRLLHLYITYVELFKTHGLIQPVNYSAITPFYNVLIREIAERGNKDALLARKYGHLEIFLAIMVALRADTCVNGMGIGGPDPSEPFTPSHAILARPFMYVPRYFLAIAIHFTEILEHRPTVSILSTFKQMFLGSNKSLTEQLNDAQVARYMSVIKNLIPTEDTLTRDVLRKLRIDEESIAKSTGGSGSAVPRAPSESSLSSSNMDQSLDPETFQSIFGVQGSFSASAASSSSSSSSASPSPVQNQRPSLFVFRPTANQSSSSSSSSSSAQGVQPPQQQQQQQQNNAFQNQQQQMMEAKDDSAMDFKRTDIINKHFITMKNVFLTSEKKSHVEQIHELATLIDQNASTKYGEIHTFMALCKLLLNRQVPGAKHPRPSIAINDSTIHVDPVALRHNDPDMILNLLTAIMEECEPELVPTGQLTENNELRYEVLGGKEAKIKAMQKVTKSLVHEYITQFLSKYIPRIRKHIESTRASGNGSRIMASLGLPDSLRSEMETQINQMSRQIASEVYSIFKVETKCTNPDHASKDTLRRMRESYKIDDKAYKLLLKIPEFTDLKQCTTERAATETLESIGEYNKLHFALPKNLEACVAQYTEMRIAGRNVERLRSVFQVNNPDGVRIDIRTAAASVFRLLVSIVNVFRVYDNHLALTYTPSVASVEAWLTKHHFVSIGKDGKKPLILEMLATCLLTCIRSVHTALEVRKANNKERYLPSLSDKIMAKLICTTDDSPSCVDLLLQDIGVVLSRPPNEEEIKRGETDHQPTEALRIVHQMTLNDYKAQMAKLVEETKNETLEETKSNVKNGIVSGMAFDYLGVDGVKGLDSNPEDLMDALTKSMEEEDRLAKMQMREREQRSKKQRGSRFNTESFSLEQEDSDAVLEALKKKKEEKRKGGELDEDEPTYESDDHYAPDVDLEELARMEREETEDRILNAYKSSEYIDKKVNALKKNKQSSSESLSRLPDEGIAVSTDALHQAVASGRMRIRDGYDVTDSKDSSSDHDIDARAIHASSSSSSAARGKKRPAAKMSGGDDLVDSEEVTSGFSSDEIGATKGSNRKRGASKSASSRSRSRSRSSSKSRSPSTTRSNTSLSRGSKFFEALSSSSFVGASSFVQPAIPRQLQTRSPSGDTDFRAFIDSQSKYRG